MQKAYIVIGANYGDEGKGLAVSSLTRDTGGTVLNILINGGAQRGHTVELLDERRHVFKHFGSGTLHGAVSFADEDFIVNPIIYNREREELMHSFRPELFSATMYKEINRMGRYPALYVSGSCRVTTPWDMMLGQIIEESRGSEKHGSCGMGIQETRLRFMNTDWALRYADIINTGKAADMYRYHQRIVDEYIHERLKTLGISLTEKWEELLNDKGIADAFLYDVKTMASCAFMCNDWKKLCDKYDTVIFEAGQGLALDMDNMDCFPHLTPSHTTSLVSAERIRTLPGETETEVIYVTRSYFTRHGAGPFPTECKKEDINPDMLDITNIPNPHQDSLRYGMFDEAELLKRVGDDRKATSAVLPNASFSLLVTHLNETNGNICGDTTIGRLAEHFDKLYVSDHKMGFWR